MSLYNSINSLLNIKHIFLPKSSKEFGLAPCYVQASFDMSLLQNVSIKSLAVLKLHPQTIAVSLHINITKRIKALPSFFKQERSSLGFLSSKGFLKNNLKNNR